MSDRITVTAVIGSYRKGGIIDSAVDAMLAGAREEGAATAKIYLIDNRIEFCTNCRSCMQEDGIRRGSCPIVDEMDAILDELERSDAIVLASPTNFGTVTAVMKRFIERLGCYAYWPWGMNSPQLRLKRMKKPAVVVASSAAPAFFTRMATQVVGLLKKAVDVMGGKTIGVLLVGFAAQRPQQALTGRTVEKARRLGRTLVIAGRNANSHT